MSESHPFHLTHDLESIKAQIAERLGSCSSFSRLAQLMPAIVESLWQQAQSAYVNNPIPSQFKHTLFTYLSRFCTVPYCVAWHAAGLVTPDLWADSGDIAPLSAEEVVALLQRPALGAAGIEEHLMRLAKMDQSCDGWPPQGSALEQSVFECAVSIYLRDPAGPRCQVELRRVLGPTWCDRLLLFLSFIRTTHFWAETHGDLPLEPELAALLREHPVLGDWLQAYREDVRRELRGRWQSDDDQQSQSGEMLRIQIRAMLADQTQRKSLEQATLDISAAEHRRIGIDLHNGIGQELAGMAMVADSLVKSLADRDLPERKIARKLAAGIQRALREVCVLARDVNPVDIDQQGLMSALTQLAQHVESLHGIRCEFHCDPPLLMRDHQTATQLYRIAQAAVNNALQYGKAKSIIISLTRPGGDAVLSDGLLSVADDGLGMAPEWDNDYLLGMQIMRYRAGVIGSQLRVSLIHEKGTELTCTIPRTVIDH